MSSVELFFILIGELGAPNQSSWSDEEEWIQIMMTDTTQHHRFSRTSV